MKTISKKALSIILCVVMLMSTFVMGITASATVVESGTCGDNLTWALDDEGTLTISGTGEMKDYFYESGYEAPWYVLSKNITSVVIISGVTNIGTYAFWNCTNLKNITIPDSVTKIGKYAFSGCAKLESVIIPNNVTSIGEEAFSKCESLQNINIPDNVMDIGESAFYMCSSLTSVTFSTNSKLKNIGPNVFSWCTSLTSITIPDGVTSIGNRAFNYCLNLINITIPDSVTSIGERAFLGCDKLVILCNKDSCAQSYCDENTLDYVLLDDDTDRYITGSLGTKLTWSIDKLQRTLTINCNGNMPSFSYNNAAPWKEYSKYFLNVVIENGCTSIGNYAFRDCTRLTSITIPDGVTSIGESAFLDCTSLTSITIPEGVTFIGDFTFRCCTSLESITIPKGVIYICESAFQDCESLTSITIPNSVTSIGYDAFYYCKSLKNINIPEGVTFIGSSAFNGCSSLTEIEIPYSVKTIEYSTFSNCSALDKIYIYNRNCSIDSSAIPYNATIYGFAGSTAETFADENGYYFVAIDDTHEHTFNDDDICKLCGYDNLHDHNWSEWIVTVENSCTEDGERYRTCSICNKIETEKIEAAGHIKSDAVKENEIAATNNSDGSYDSVIYCAVCNQEISREKIVVEAISEGYVKSLKVSNNTVTKGDYLTWTILTSNDVTDIKLAGSYEINGAKKTISVIYKNTSTNANLKVTDEDGVRTWVIKQRFTFIGDVDSVTENYVAYYKTANNSTYVAFNKDEPITLTVYESASKIPQDIEEYLPYTLISVTGPTAIKAGTRGDVTIVTTDDCAKVRIGYMTAAGTMKYTTYQTTTTSNVSYTDANGLRTWTISYKFSDATNYSVNARGPAWGAEKTFTV